MGQAALALGAAHEAGVVHRDVKPANILLMPDGTVKLTDFGIARAVDGSGQTQTGEVLGTPHYLSPEQALGEPATGASDLYALGVVAHELLTGRRPFDRGTPVATALAQVTTHRPAASARPAGLRALITQCLAKRPEDGRRAPASWRAPGAARGGPPREAPRTPCTSSARRRAGGGGRRPPGAPPRKNGCTDPTPTPTSVAGAEGPRPLGLGSGLQRRPARLAAVVVPHDPLTPDRRHVGWRRVATCAAAQPSGTRRKFGCTRRAGSQTAG